MVKTAADFAKDLCDIIDKITPLKVQVKVKQELFAKIFEIFDQDASEGHKGMFWDAVIDQKCIYGKTYGDKLNVKLPRIMYRTSNKLFNRETGQEKYIQVVSLLFLELLLDLIRKLKDKYSSSSDREILHNFISLVEHSDTSGVLNIGIDNLSNFLELTTDNKERLKTVIKQIDNEFERIQYERKGNYSLAHLIRNYCKGLIGESADDDDDSDDDDAANGDGDISGWEIVKDVDFTPEKSKLPIETAFKLLHSELQQGSTVTFSKPICRYGPNCYQTNAEHIAKFDHSSREKLGGGRKQQTKRIKHSTRRRSSSKRTRRHTRRRHRH
jgi:hypothetical protein